MKPTWEKLYQWPWQWKILSVQDRGHHCWSAAFKTLQIKITSWGKKPNKIITGACFALGVDMAMIHILFWVSSTLLLIRISLSDCCMIRSKKKTHFNRPPSQINSRIPSVTALHSHLTKFFYSKLTSFSKFKTEYAKMCYNAKPRNIKKQVFLPSRTVIA